MSNLNLKFDVNRVTFILIIGYLDINEKLWNDQTQFFLGSENKV